MEETTQDLLASPFQEDFVKRKLDIHLHERPSRCEE